MNTGVMEVSAHLVGEGRRGGGWGGMRGGKG